VTGVLVRTGGPAVIGRTQSAVPLPGEVVARNTAGEQFTSPTGQNGRFQLSLPPGAYRLTGHSPQVWVNGSERQCTVVQTLEHIQDTKTARPQKLQTPKVRGVGLSAVVRSSIGSWEVIDSC
jgi:hypothetical protein